ncbi:uncharacterized protein RAG0_17179 [Rhynchosporium agropyri]|uniref:Tse2 ADP-ribosyltransferase toxin domain-containing protein n=1 Tax=Rhynchosporium agropyri TaxID=914238 RepID=A0A1E1LT95_9HELO|nr:uncharacterized protein RAG0_17179 [Rhynchosporium agropyri]
MGDTFKWDGLEVSKTGLIEPGASKNPLLYKGAMMMPNTFTMQEIIRTEVDYYFDNEEISEEVETPFVYCIQKGTPLPGSIVLYREGLSRFSLQASRAISVESLNTLLDEYFEKYAEKFTAQQWLDENDFNSAVGDDAVTVWMAK